MKSKEILENICLEYTEDADFRDGFFNVLIYNQYFEDIKKNLRNHLQLLKSAAKESSLSDVSSSLAYLMFEKNFSLPSFNSKKTSSIKGGFHPVCLMS